MLSTAVRTVCRLAVCIGAATSIFATASIAGAAPAALPLAAPADAPANAGQELADLAANYVGSRYVWGGMSPAGFDCTGFVKFIYAQYGIELPHNEAGQLASGPQVDAADLEAGDVLVFANTYRRGLSHVGIYLGEGRFVHAVDEAHGVMVSNLWDGYWSPRLVGATRTLSAPTSALT